MSNNIELRSWLDTHDRPFVIIDREYRIVATNRAFDEAFANSTEHFQGRRCYEAVHRSDVPCHELGHDCPYQGVFDPAKRPGPGGTNALHTHFDSAGRLRWVRVKSFELTAANGEIYVGELLDELGAEEVVEPQSEHELVGRHPAFLKAIEQLELAAHSNGPVLLQGETGTGKELAARFIHRNSARRAQPFIAVDCTVLTETLFESEMFGHERGAFTGSVGSRKGLFEIADGGTLLLDEIGELSLEMQAKLLRVLETGEFRRLGGHQTQSANVRIVCATNRPLWESVQAGDFRADLYYRIACFCVRMPPLRERLEDVPLLAERLLRRIGQSMDATYTLSASATARLRDYDYPGNVRELRNILEIASARSKGPAIEVDLLERTLGMVSETRREPLETVPPTACKAGRRGMQTAAFGLGELLGDGAPTIHDLEEDYIRSLLDQFGGHRRMVAERMGVSERTLYRKLKRYGLG